MHQLSKRSQEKVEHILYKVELKHKVAKFVRWSKIIRRECRILKESRKQEASKMNNLSFHLMKTEIEK